ncbi:hypothetical protein TNCT_125711 [Trichonephila clavata]|uniref:Uncharacterized protein n=1 Tax=Trichonephila clavata TaxID=2740835 RepID=A0A8X6HX74_TRICU|nr:hypothetical protein TNCT_125711 [Trichonephila clavata]
MDIHTRLIHGLSLSPPPQTESNSMKVLLIMGKYLGPLNTLGKKRYQNATSSGLTTEYRILYGRRTASRSHRQNLRRGLNAFPPH